MSDYRFNDKEHMYLPLPGARQRRSYESDDGDDDHLPMTKTDSERRKAEMNRHFAVRQAGLDNDAVSDVRNNRDGGAKHLAGRVLLLQRYYAYKKSCSEYDKYVYGRYQEANLAKYSAEKDSNLERLNESLKENGFRSINELTAYVHNYEKTFEKRTLDIARESLSNYAQLLNAELEKLNNDAYVLQLYNQLVLSGAKQHYHKAAQNRQAASSIQRDLGGYAPDDATLKRDLNRAAAGQEASGREAVQTLGSVLVKEEQFKADKLAQVKSSTELKEFFQEYIRNKLASIADTRQDLRTHPERIYELDALVTLSKQKQNISAGHPLELIIAQKTEALGEEKMLAGATIAVLAMALGLLTFGTGTVALALAAGNFAVGVFLTVKEIEVYQRQLAAYNVNISKDEPSAVWVILAVAGTVLDAAAIAKISKQLVNAGRVYSKSGDVLLAEKELAKIRELDVATRTKALEALKAHKKRNYEQFVEFIDAHENIPGNLKPPKSREELLEIKREKLQKKRIELSEEKLASKLEKIKRQTFEERKIELGTDPVKGYVDIEGEIGAKLEKQFGYFNRYTEPDLEWISLSGEYKGKTFDLIGLEPGISDKLTNDMIDFIDSLIKHFLKADVVILDYRYMNNEQIRSIEEYLQSQGIFESKTFYKIWSNPN